MVWPGRPKTPLRGADFDAPETRTRTAKVRGGVRRFVRTRLRNRIPANREVFREFRVSRVHTPSGIGRESQLGRHFLC